MLDPKVALFASMVLRLKLRLWRDSPCGAGSRHASCAIGPVRVVALGDRVNAFFADRVLAWAPVRIGLGAGADVLSPNAHRLLVLASPSGYLSYANFILIPDVQSRPARRLADAASKGFIASGTTCKPWLGVRDAACEFGQLRAVLSTPASHIVAVLGSASSASLR